MDNGFTLFIPQSRAFLTQLDQSNTRDWFLKNKTRYDAELKAPALWLLDQIAHDLGKQTGDDIDTKLFRAHRDLRFSKDKTPYHTHLHMLWTSRAGDRQSIGYFFGISPDYVRAGLGVMQFDKKVLHDWRAALDTPKGDAIFQTIQNTVQSGAILQDPDLKRVPAPFAKDHPRGDLLRRKGLTIWQDLPPAEFGDPVRALHTAFSALEPVSKILKSLL